MGRAVLGALSGEASEGAVGLAGADGGRRGWEIYTQRAFLSTDAVVIVPGFLASALGDTAAGGFGLIWADPLLPIRDELGALQLAPYDGRERDLYPKVRIGALSALPYLYDILRLALEVRRYTVEMFAVDWRKDMELSAGMLAARLRALAGQSWRPIHLVAHSQGRWWRGGPCSCSAATRRGGSSSTWSCSARPTSAASRPPSRSRATTACSP